MEIKKDIHTSYHYMNDLNVIVRKYGNMGIGDSLGRTAIGSLVYDEDRERLINGVKSYFYRMDKSLGSNRVYVCRYPDKSNYKAYGQGNSRDHVLKAITALKLHGENYFVKWFIKEKAKRPSIDTGYTIDQRIWFRALYSDFWSWMYVLVSYPFLTFSLGLNKLLRLIGGFKSYSNPEEYTKANVKPNKLQLFLRKIMFPTYAFFYTAFSLHAIKSKSARKAISLILKHHFEKTNYVGRALCGEEIVVDHDSYKPSRKNRWSTRLDQTNDRDMRAYNDNPSDNIEMAMLIKYTKNGSDNA